MASRWLAAGLPVLLIYNLDPTWEPHARDEVERETRRLATAMVEVGHPVSLMPVADGGLATRLLAFSPDDQLVFNWCESLPGIPYSEALVADALEDLGFAFTGADAKALTLSQNKQRVKELLTENGIPTPWWRVYETTQVGDWEGFPAIVKPVYEHSSIGITPEAVVLTRDELAGRVRFVLDTLHQPALVEDFIDGREFRVSLWGRDRPVAMPVAEMDYSAFPEVRQRLCTYESKHDPESLHYRKIETLLPAPLRKEEVQRLCDTAASAYFAAGCRDYGRIDLRLRDGVFYVLDVNPNPDLSADASLACAAELAGFSYGVLGSCLVALAACRHPRFRQPGAALLKLWHGHLDPA